MGGGHIFSGHIDVSCIAPMMVAMLAFAMFFEYTTNHVEAKVRRPTDPPVPPPARAAPAPPRCDAGSSAMLRPVTSEPS